MVPFLSIPPPSLLGVHNIRVEKASHNSGQTGFSLYRYIIQKVLLH